MTLMRILTLALIVACPSVVRGDDAEKETLDGTWAPTLAEMDGRKLPDEVLETIELEIKDGAYTVTLGDATDKGTCTIDPSKSPKELDVKGVEGPNAGKTILGIYERKGDVLKVCYDFGGKSRPKDFKAEAGSGRFLAEYKLKKD